MDCTSKLTASATSTIYTDKLFTGQRDTGLGIYNYGARFYSPKLGRFLSPDSIVPGMANPQNMIARSGEVKTCAENLAQWIPQLKEQAQKIITAASLAEMQAPVEEAVALANKIRNGVDLDGNAKVDPLAGECGVATTYESAYAMADVPLLPVNLLGTATATAGTPAPASTVIIRTPTKRSGGSGGQVNTPVPLPVQPTKNNNPGSGGGNKKPTHTPKP